jgi:hypothetical protein
MAVKKNVAQKILDMAGDFVVKQDGAWGHDEWEAFLGNAAGAGAPMDDEGKRNLGNILEASKYLYFRASSGALTKPATPRSGAKSPAAKSAAKKAAPSRKKG